ncbi:MAG: hypothetical protein ABFD16_25225 [Thermoguttaceae bacterium]
MRTGMIAIGAAFALLLVAASATLLLGQAPAKPIPKEEFAGKILVVYVNGTGERMGGTLRDAKLIQVGGRTFLAGIGVAQGEEYQWADGVPVRFAWDQVSFYYLMTEEQNKAADKATRRQAVAEQHL